MRELLEKTLSVNELDVKKALRTAAVTGAIGGAALGLGLQKGVTPKDVEKPVTTVAVEEPAERVSVDMKKIAEIESSSNPEAENSRTGARGLCQIMKSTWEEMTSKMGVDWPWDEAFNEKANKEVAYYYLNTEIPRLLKHFGIEDTIETRLVAYNFGIGALKQLYKKYGEDWKSYLPKETIGYVDKYLGK